MTPPKLSNRYEIAGELGRAIGLTVPDLVAIEIDGAAFHGGAEASQRDDRRTNRIVLLGWRVLRFTARDLADRPADVAREIQEALSFGPASLSGE